MPNPHIIDLQGEVDPDTGEHVVEPYSVVGFLDCAGTDNYVRYLDPQPSLSQVDRLAVEIVGQVRVAGGQVALAVGVHLAPTDIGDVLHDLDVVGHGGVVIACSGVSDRASATVRTTAVAGRRRCTGDAPLGVWAAFGLLLAYSPLMRAIPAGADHHAAAGAGSQVASWSSPSTRRALVMTRAKSCHVSLGAFGEA
jgi:hypothetical protein